MRFQNLCSFEGLNLLWWFPKTNMDLAVLSLLCFLFEIAFKGPTIHCSELQNVPLTERRMSQYQNLFVFQPCGTSLCHIGIEYILPGAACGGRGTGGGLEEACRACRGREVQTAALTLPFLNSAGKQPCCEMAGIARRGKISVLLPRVLGEFQEVRDLPGVRKPRNVSAHCCWWLLSRHL